MRSYKVQMLHPNANANRIIRVSAQNKGGARLQAHAWMVRTGQFFTTGDVVAL